MKPDWGAKIITHPNYPPKNESPTDRISACCALTSREEEKWQENILFFAIALLWKRSRVFSKNIIFSAVPSPPPLLPPAGYAIKHATGLKGYKFVVKRWRDANALVCPRLIILSVVFLFGALKKRSAPIREKYRYYLTAWSFKIPHCDFIVVYDVTWIHLPHLAPLRLFILQILLHGKYFLYYKHFCIYFSAF